MTPTESQIREQVKALLEHGADALAVGIYAERQQDWPAELALDSRRFSLRWCDSPLAVRLALHESRRHDTGGTVILTPLTDHALGADVLARLSRGKVFRVQHWDIVRHAFQARSVEARLGQHGWMADLLIEHMPAQGYPPAPSGTLDAETAWRSLLDVTIGLDTARPDIETLLRWTSRPEALTRFAALPERPRAGIIDWLEDTTGPAGHLVLGVVAGGAGYDAIPLGLIAGMLLAEEKPGAELAAAAVRLERFTSGRRLDAVGGKRWAEAAERIVREPPHGAAQPFLDRADRLLSELYLTSFAALSRTLPSGLEARFGAFGQALDGFLTGGSEASLAVVEGRANEVRNHDLAPLAPNRLERVEMATRLARWLPVAAPKPVGFEGWIADYAGSGAFVDWARLKLLGGDPIAALSAAYNTLAERARERQEAVNHSFAEALKGWNEAGSAAASIPVERVLDEIVAQLAKDAPVLLLVVDGLSLPVFAELAPDLAKLGWVSHQREGGKWLGTAVAALPTVTEISRASLLAGRLTSGTQSAEKAAFSQHVALMASARPSAPVLFHKGELGDGLGLSSTVRDAVGSRNTRIVGVVYNAIDDQLDGATQIHLSWTLEDLRLLPALLHEARGAGRVLVVTADHGHVVENQTRQRAGQDGDRWRRPDGALSEGEIRIDGGRVLTPAGTDSMIAPWSETIRYGAKKNGYHGGVSPQEVVVPLAVYAPSGMIVPGWTPMPSRYPDWWLGPVASLPPAVPLPVPGMKKSVAGQPDLFAAPAAPAGDWIAALMSSTTYQTQKTLAARVAPADDDIRRLLEALAERGGKLSKTAVAQRLNLPVLRVSGFLSAARRVLNVDQSVVLSVDETSGTVELNQNLLAKQFQTEER